MSQSNFVQIWWREVPFPIHKLSSLKTLRLTHCPRVDFQTFLSFNTSTGIDMSLDSLDVQGNSLGARPRILQECLWPFVAKCPKLQDLSLRDDAIANLAGFAGLLEFPRSCLRTLSLDCNHLLKPPDHEDGRSHITHFENRKQLVRILEQHFQLCDIDIWHNYIKDSKIQTLLKLKNASGIHLLGEVEECRSVHSCPIF
jgi:hypothetical protein